MHTKSSLRGDCGFGKPPSVAIPQMVVFLIFVFIAHLSGDLPKIRKMPKTIQNHPSVVIKGPGAIFLLVFRPHILCDLLKIKKTHTRKIIPLW